MPLNIVQAGEEITFSLIGAKRDGGYVRVSELSECFDRIQECLRETERCLTGKASHLTYLMKSLKVGSPAVGVIEAKKPRRVPDNRAAIAQEFRKTVSGLQRGDRRRNPLLDHHAYSAYRKLGEIIHKTDERARPSLILDGTVVTHEYLVSADKVLEFEESALGSISGRMDKLDVHGKNTFAIFPPTTTHQVWCSFEDDLLPKVLASVTKTVTVYGMMHYVADRFMPMTVEAHDIEPHEPEEKLPRLTAMAGRLSHLTEDSLKIVGRLRDEWEE